MVTDSEFAFDINTTATATVTINGGSGNARLYGWVDFNGDGDFADGNEQISDGTVTLADGPYDLIFTVPDAGFVGTSYARFRVSTDTNLSFDGAASDGEVEDYRVCIVDSTVGPATSCLIEEASVSERFSSWARSHRLANRLYHGR